MTTHYAIYATSVIHLKNLESPDLIKGAVVAYESEHGLSVIEYDDDDRITSIVTFCPDAESVDPTFDCIGSKETREEAEESLLRAIGLLKVTYHHKKA